MQIRTRLTFQFLLAGGVIIIIASIAIYSFSANFRKQDFYKQLTNNALNNANIIFGKYEVDASRISMNEQYNPIALNNEKLIIINSKNDTVYNSDKNNEIKLDKSVLKKIGDGYKVSGRHGKYDVVGTMYFTNFDIFILIAAATDDEGHAHLKKMLWLLVIVCIICLLLFVVVGWFYSARAIKPISDIVKKVEDISDTSLNLRLTVGSNPDEIGRLAQTFNKMLERIETSFNTQKGFIANASHELRTPLTSINGQLEVLLIKDRSLDEYKTEVTSVLRDIKSLISLANSLLLMARSGSEFPLQLNNRVRIDEIIWQVGEEMQKYNKDYIIAISMDESLNDFDQMIVSGDEYMLKIAISNIIDNACKYSDNHTAKIKFYSVGGYLKIEVADSGIGISKEAVKKVFEPFYRGTNTALATGFGIGLPLANQIIKSHNGEIKISSEINKGTTIIISLPVIAN